jgi:transposase-like protein
VETNLSVKETARAIGVTTGTLRKWRCQGKGPKGYFKLSKMRGVYPVTSPLKTDPERG